MEKNNNYITKYIKRQLGASVNQIEITDDGIYDLIEESLYEISISIPYYKEFIINPEYIISSLNSFEYKIPDNNYTILGVKNVFYYNGNSIDLINGGLYGYDSRTLDDYVINSVYLQMGRSVSLANVAEFKREDDEYPNRIRLSIMLSTPIVCQLNIVYPTLSCVPDEIFMKCFRYMCHKKVLEYIYGIRFKYANITTPNITINLNVSDLQNQIQILDQKINEFIDNYPITEISFF